MKTLYKYMTMAVLAVVTMCVFSACGGDDGDDLPEGYVKTTEGVHRIEVSFDGDLKGWNGQLMFIATYGTSRDVKIYENGQILADDGGVIIEQVRNITVESEAKCDQMNVAVTIQHYPGASVNPITIILKGYVNGTQKNMKTVEIPSTEAYKTIIFNAENIGADVL